jgi:choline dehydrogenase
VSSDDDVLAWVAAHARTGYHPVGTARMGRDAGAVVDPDTLGVHGVDGLRVVDASIMPTLTNANTYAPVTMIAEKAADVVLGHTPLVPERREAAPTGVTG